MTLAQLAVGDRARIVALNGEDEAVERIMEMGLVEGTEFSLVRFAPLGDPLEIKARGYHLTLRKAEAANIEVENCRSEQKLALKVYLSCELFYSY